MSDYERLPGQAKEPAPRLKIYCTECERLRAAAKAVETTIFELLRLIEIARANAPGPNRP